MPHEVPRILRALADLYRKSAAGSHGGARDFICDYEQLLRHANCHDGDEREKAEEDLKRAELESGKRLSLDRAARSGIYQRVRLSKEGGESWLFQRLRESPPSGQRSELASFFKSMTDQPVPESWREQWRAWCESMEDKAVIQGSVQPFRRDDPAGNEEFLKALLGVIHWQDESLIRFASSVICGDSKRLEKLESRLVSALQAIRGDDVCALEDCGILKKPRALTFHGPLVLKFGNERVDFGLLPGPCRISEINLAQADEVTTDAALCLTVENEEVFLELAKRNRGWLLVHTSFPGAAVRRLFNMLRPDLNCSHFGDSDPAGFDILRDLREKTGWAFQPVCMEFRPDPEGLPLTKDERKTIDRLLATPLMTDVHAALRKMLEAGSKGAFEQESVPIADVVTCIGARTSTGPDAPTD
ncbi:MAG: Wadjet anti-phage system protein JetD domain-containing protein [Luteolibacter sp.]